MSEVYKGKYKQIKSIGKGVSGIIYLVESVTDGKLYCAKHISLNSISQIAAKKQLQIIQTLKNPFIVQYIDSFKSQHDFIIIMEYCKQRDLAHHIQLMKSKNKHFNQNLVITWLFQLVLGLQFIHSKKILHRDIKPQNIFIDQKLNIKIGDFGISRILSSTGEHCKTIAGTPFYLAPQICRQEKYTSKADIWSLGCVIYQICALQRPFKPKGGPLQIYQQIITAPVKQIPNIYSQGVKKLVLKMMTRDEAKRPNTTQLLKDPVLVDLMIKNSSSLSLKQQYSNNIQKNSQLTDSFIDKQTSLVHDQLKQFEEQVKLKMQSLKKKQVNNELVDYQYVQLKKKMQDIQKAISKAFVQLKKKTQKPKSQKSQQSISIKKATQTLKNSSQLSNSSEMTIYQSVMIGQNKKSSSLSNSINKNNSASKKSRLQQIIAQSAQYESVPVIQTTKNINSLSNNSILSAESMMIQDDSNFNNSQSLKINSKVSNSIKQSMSESQSMDQTLVSQYQNTLKQTVKQSKLAKNTLDKLNFLQKTLSQNPDAILNGSLLNFTLTMSEDEIRKSLNLGKGNPTNTLSMRVRNEKNLDQTINFDLTKRQSQPSDRMQRGFKKKVQGNKLSQSQNKNFQVLTKQQHYQQIDEGYDDDFESYEEQEQDEDQLAKSMSSPVMQRRKSELNTIISFYQQTLQQINNQSQMNQTFSQTQKVKHKYPLIMSEIKQQNGEAGSILSKNNNSSNNNNFSAF